MTDLDKLIAEANEYHWRITLFQQPPLTWQAILYTHDGIGFNYGTGTTPEAALQRAVETAKTDRWMLKADMPIDTKVWSLEPEFEAQCGPADDGSDLV